MTITRKTRRDVIDKLTPHMGEATRQTIVRGAWWGDSILQRVQWDGDAPAFTAALVNTALMHGPLDDGDPPLPALLDEVRLHAPPASRAAIAALLDDVRGEMRLTPPESSDNEETLTDLVKADAGTPNADWNMADTITDKDTSEMVRAAVAEMENGDTLSDSTPVPGDDNADDDWDKRKTLVVRDATPPPTPDKDLFEQAALRLAARDYDGAVALYMDAADAGDRPADAHYQIGRVMEILRDYDSALVQYEQSLNYEPAAPRVHTRRGVIQALRGNRDAALAAFEQATAGNAPDPAGYFYRGMLHFDEANYDDALADLTSAIKHRPAYAAAYRERGVIYTVKGRYEDAREQYSVALSHDADDAETYYYRANIHALHDDTEDALADYTRAIELAPDHPQYHYRRGKLLVGLERYGDALPSLEATVALEADNADAHFLLALCRMKHASDYAGAVPLLKQALSLDPANQEYAAGLRIAQEQAPDA